MPKILTRAAAAAALSAATAVLLAVPAHAEVRDKTVTDPTGDLIAGTSTADTALRKNSVDISKVTYTVDTTAERLYAKYRVADVSDDTTNGYQSYETSIVATMPNGHHRWFALYSDARLPHTLVVFTRAGGIACAHARQILNPTTNLVTQSLPLSCLKNPASVKMTGYAVLRDSTSEQVVYDTTNASKALNTSLAPPPPVGPQSR